MRGNLFKYSMLIGAFALLGVAAYYFTTYISLSIALKNSSLVPFYNQSIRAMWLGFCLQACLLGALYLLVAFRPHAISRPVIIICGLLPMVEAVLTFSYTGSFVAMWLLTIAALFVLLAALVWPAPYKVEASVSNTEAAPDLTTRASP
ncbi:MAG: hypothetical protein ABI859_07405 [Pseudomonadota bacterium]